MTAELAPHLASLMRQYARDLSSLTPSSALDARIDRLVARPPTKFAPAPRRRSVPVPLWAAAAGFAAIAICAGVLIGMRVEQSRQMTAAVADLARGPSWPPPELSLFPSDSVSLQIPAVYSSAGKLVAVEPGTDPGGKRYWIDVVVSNNGTFRIENIVPAQNPDKNSRSGPDGAQQTQ